MWIGQKLFTENLFSQKIAVISYRQNSVAIRTHDVPMMFTILNYFVKNQTHSKDGQHD